jgi:hypothetical protein
MPAKDEQLTRSQNANQLVEELGLNQDAEFFSDPVNRLEFISTLSYDDFFDVIQHVNARMRSQEPRHGLNAHDAGSGLPMLKTPDPEDKPKALQGGFEVIQTYLSTTDDSIEEKVQSVGMAVEALIVWVHPFNDGNGRTSRFMGKFIEDGTVDTEQLANETSDKNERLRMYPAWLRVDSTTDWRDTEILLDDDEREAIRLEQERLPITDGIPLSIERFLNDKSLQQRVINQTNRYQAIRNEAQQT